MVSRMTKPPRWLVWMMFALGLLLVGGFLGHLMTPPTTISGVLPPLPETTASARPGVQGSMPDLLGLDELTAQQVLAEFGVTAPTTTSTRPSAGPAGRIVAQSPAPGSANVSEVALTLSQVVAMPDLARKSATQARDTLEALGAVARLEYTVRPELAAGSVISTEPAAGKPLGLVAVLKVSEEGEGLTLDQVPTIDVDRCSSDGAPTTVAGRSVKRTVWCQAALPTEVAFAEYAVRGKAAYLEARIGMDDGRPAGSARVRVVVDGKPAGEWKANKAQLIRIPLTPKSLRIRIEVSRVSSPESWVVFGDARFVGTADALAELSAAR